MTVNVKTKKTNNQTGDFAGEIRQSEKKKIWYSKWKIRKKNRREIEEKGNRKFNNIIKFEFLRLRVLRRN